MFKENENRAMDLKETGMILKAQNLNLYQSYEEDPCQTSEVRFHLGYTLTTFNQCHGLLNDGVRSSMIKPVEEYRLGPKTVLLRAVTVC